MEKRSFVLGIGIGIIFSVIIIWAAVGISEDGSIDDSEVEKRARELGMEYISETVSEESAEASSETVTYEPEAYKAEKTEDAQEPEKETYDNEKPAFSEKELANALSDGSENKKAAENGGEKKDNKNERTVNDNQVSNFTENSGTNNNSVIEENLPAEQTDGETYIDVTINAGTNAKKVSNILAEKGVISDAAEYERFLIDNNKTKSIRTGKYKIPQNITYEELTKILSERPKSN